MLAYMGMAMTPEQRKKELARLRKIAKKGGEALKKSRPKDYFKKIGAEGGKAKWADPDKK